MSRIGHNIGIAGLLIGLLVSPAWALTTLDVQCPPTTLGAPFGITTMGGTCGVPVSLAAGEGLHLTVRLPATCFPGVHIYRVASGPDLESPSMPGTWMAQSGISAIRFPDGSAMDAAVSFHVQNDSATPTTAIVGFKWGCASLGF